MLCVNSGGVQIQKCSLEWKDRTNIHNVSTVEEGLCSSKIGYWGAKGKACGDRA